MGDRAAQIRKEWFVKCASVVLQARVPVLAGDSAETLAARVLEQEHLIYPLAIRWFLEGRLQLRGDGACLDGEPLPPTGIDFCAQPR